MTARKCHLSSAPIPSSEILFIKQTQPLCPRSSGRLPWISDLLTLKRSRAVTGSRDGRLSRPACGAAAWPVNTTQAWTVRCAHRLQCTHCFCGIASLRAELGSVILVATGIPHVPLQDASISRRSQRSGPPLSLPPPLSFPPVQSIPLPTARFPTVFREDSANYYGPH